MFVKQTVKGMRDILPAENEIREYLLDLLKSTYRSYGYSLIETPCMEHIENLSSKQGGENEKLIFKILKRGEKLGNALSGSESDLVDSGMRYDLTVPLARYYANNAASLTLPFKAMQIGPVWRADRPQKGRFRQFTQCDIDILGDNSCNAEIELIHATTTFLDKAGVRGCTVLINDRRLLKAMMDHCGFPEESHGDVLIILDKFDKIGSEGVKNELLEAGYSSGSVDRYYEFFDKLQKAEDTLEFCAGTLSEVLPEGTADNLKAIIATVRELTSAGDTKFVFDPTLVRGMGYYTGTIFEIRAESFKGISIAGGGRYDKMIGKYIGSDVCACGFSIGFERMIGALIEGGFDIPGRAEKIAVLYRRSFTLQDVTALQKECNKFREQGKRILIQQMNKNLGFQKKQLAEQGYRIVEIAAPEEAAAALS